jgi:cellulose synthase/poly-beta-1,6-N-acetylglucosamine synthase-like glycosyltransferase
VAFPGNLGVWFRVAFLRSKHDVISSLVNVNLPLDRIMQYTWIDRRKWNRWVERGSVAEGQRNRISVVIPLYNHARFIGEAVDSVLLQGSIVRELIVVDDGSSDESAAVMREIKRRDPRIVFWSQPNRGAHTAINSGLWRATGYLLTILNSDDVYAPARLTRLADALDADPSADIAASGDFLHQYRKRVYFKSLVRRCGALL